MTTMNSVGRHRQVIQQVMPAIQDAIGIMQADSYCRDNKRMTVDDALDAAIKTEDHVMETLCNVRNKLKSLLEGDPLPVHPTDTFVQSVTIGTKCGSSIPF